MRKDVILDFDGVVVPSIDVGTDSIIQAAINCGLRPPSLSQLKGLWGNCLETGIIPILAKKLNWRPNCETDILAAFIEISSKIKYPTQKNLLLILNRYSKLSKLGIATNRDLKSLLFRLEEQGIDPGMFSHIQSSDSGVVKPDPKMLAAFWNGAGFKPENTIFIGDSIQHDLALAKAHQPEITFVGIVGMHSFSDFMKAGIKSTHMFKSTEEALSASYLF